jgi:hypothetical protein
MLIAIFTRARHLDPILSQMNPVHIITHYFFEIRFIVHFLQIETNVCTGNDSADVGHCKQCLTTYDIQSSSVSLLLQASSAPPDTVILPLTSSHFLSLSNAPCFFISAICSCRSSFLKLRPCFKRNDCLNPLSGKYTYHLL